MATKADALLGALPQFVTQANAIAAAMNLKSTRGERNNNPGNIRMSNINWLGEVVGYDHEFESFDKPEHGIRALAKILLNYSDKYHLKTVQQIICRWAPSVENDTGAYVNAVCDECGVISTMPLNLHDVKTLFNLTKAIIRHENGRVIYSDDVIMAGVNMALGKIAS